MELKTNNRNVKRQTQKIEHLLTHEKHQEEKMALHKKLIEERIELERKINEEKIEIEKQHNREINDLKDQQLKLMSSACNKSMSAFKFITTYLTNSPPLKK